MSKIDTTGAVQAYFNRMADGSADAEDKRMFLTMLDRYEKRPAEPEERPRPEYLDGMSEEGKRGVFPPTGLVTAVEVAAFLRKEGVKDPTQSLMAMVRAGRLCPPAYTQGKPYKWWAEEVRTFVAGVKPGRRAA